MRSAFSAECWNVSLMITNGCFGALKKLHFTAHLQSIHTFSAYACAHIGTHIMTMTSIFTLASEKCDAIIDSVPTRANHRKGAPPAERHSLLLLPRSGKAHPKLPGPEALVCVYRCPGKAWPVNCSNLGSMVRCLGTAGAKTDQNIYKEYKCVSDLHFRLENDCKCYC